MPVVRQLLAHRHLALLICAAALLLKLLVPSGYMIGADRDHIRVTICSGTSARTVLMALPSVHGDLPDHDRSGDHAKAGMPCAYAGLGAAALAAADPIQLAALVAFIMAIGGSIAARGSPTRPPHLRPPLRGPPAHL